MAIALIINDGNIFGTKNANSQNTFLPFLNKIFGTKKGTDPFDPVAIKYYELEDETTCIEQPTTATLQRIENQLLTRSGRIDMDQSL